MSAKQTYLRAAVSVLLAACGPTGAPGPTGVAEQSPSVAPPSSSVAVVVSIADWLALPVAPGLEPVSRSDPNPDASQALDACWITDSEGQLEAVFGLDAVAGMAQVIDARDVPKYVPLWGVEPDLQTSDPVWVIRLRGEQVFPTFKLRDPTCIVIRGVKNWFSTGANNVGGPWRDDPAPPSGQPQLRLPPLDP